MRRKAGYPFEQYFPKADPNALNILKRLLAFDPSDRPTAEQALADPYFAGLHNKAREPAAQPVSKLAFEFERRKLSTEEVRELIYREILEYHPQMLADYERGHHLNLSYPSAVDNFKRQFAYLEAGGVPGGEAALSRTGTEKEGGQRPLGGAQSLPRERVQDFQLEAAKYMNDQAKKAAQAAKIDEEEEEGKTEGTISNLGDAVQNMKVEEGANGQLEGCSSSPLVRSNSIA